MTWPQRIFVADITGPFIRSLEDEEGSQPSPRLRPKLQSMPPSARVTPET